MSIAMALGGYTGGEADELRRTMGNIRKQKRLEGALAKLHERMIANESITPRVTPEIATRDVRRPEEFRELRISGIARVELCADRVRNGVFESALSCGVLFGTLNAWPMGFYSPATLIHDAKRQKVEVRAPCLCDGNWECTTEPSADPNVPALRIGWRFVRGMGERTLERLRNAHDAAQFTSIADVVRRARLTRAESTSLALAGAFGAWEKERRKASWEALRAVSDTLPFAPAHRAMHNPAPLGKHELIAIDYHSTGTSIHGHPMMALRERLRGDGVKDSRDLESARNGSE